MYKPNLYSDCDGVLVNTIDVAYEDMIEKGCNMNDRNEVDYFFRKVIDWREIFDKASTINDSFAKLRMLKASGLFNDVFICTGISGNYTEEGIKRELFAYEVPGIKVITVQYGIKKASIIAAPQRHILVDDEPRYVNNWNSYGEEDTAILFVQNYYF